MQKQVTLIILWVAALTPAAAIVCYECGNVIATTSGGLIGSLPNAPPENPSCSSADPYRTRSVTCPDESNKCVYVNTTVTVTIPVVGSVHYTVEGRGCIPRSSRTLADTGCFDDITGPTKKIVNGLLKFTDFSALSLSGKACYCSTDKCDAKCDGLFFLDRCWPLWQVILLGIVGAITAGFVVSCCCCCCCCCSCCRNKNPGTVLGHTQVLVIPGHSNAAAPYPTPGQAYPIDMTTAPGYSSPTGAVAAPDYPYADDVSSPQRKNDKVPLV